MLGAVIVYRYFHVTEGLIPDVMHDILEGALPLEVKEFLKYHIRKKTFSLSNLKEAMETFPYGGIDSSNQPTPIAATTLSSSDHLLKQTGQFNITSLDFIVYYVCCSYTDVVLS